MLYRGESGPSSLDSRQLEREFARERRISGGTFDTAASVKERRVSGMSVQGGVRESRVSGDVMEGGGRERRVSGKSLLRVASSNSINLRCAHPLPFCNNSSSLVAQGSRQKILHVLHFRAWQGFHHIRRGGGLATASHSWGLGGSPKLLKSYVRR